jgi:hypothetical protein
MRTYLRARVDALDADSGRHLIGGPMLIERRTGDTVRIALHDQRAVFEHRAGRRAQPVRSDERGRLSSASTSARTSCGDSRPRDVRVEGDDTSARARLNLVELRQQRLNAALCERARVWHPCPPSRASSSTNTGRRRRPSFVQPENRTATASFGLTQWRARLYRGRQETAPTSSSALATASRSDRVAHP